ncbi:MAG: hypothetical protein ACLQVI_32975 [Polyangiaceae bacterium]|jgi:hypothetical protein
MRTLFWAQLTLAFTSVLLVATSPAGCVSNNNPLAPAAEDSSIEIDTDAAFDVSVGPGQVDSSTDTGITDSGSGSVDTGSTDAGSGDAGSVDAAPVDAGPGDAATPDAGTDAAPEAGLTTGVVATGGTSTWPVGIAVIGENVYWLDTGLVAGSNAGTFQTCNPTTGNCGSPTVFSGMTGLGPNQQLATDGTSFFMPIGGVSIYSTVSMMECPVSGCSDSTLTQLYSSVGGTWDDITGVAVDSANLYFGGGAGVPDSGNVFGIYVADKAGINALQTLVSGLPTTANLAIEGSTLYYGLAGGGIYECSVAPDAGPCTPTLVQATVSTSGLAVDSTSIYWGDPASGAVYRCPIAGCGDAAAPTAIASGVGPVNCLALDSPFVLYTVGDNADAGSVNGVFAAQQ